MDFLFKLGEKVKYQHAPYSGVITAVCQYASGTRTYEVTSSSLGQDGKPVECWIAEGSLTKGDD